MKKSVVKILAIAMLLALFTAFIGCGQSEPAAEQEPTADEQKPAESSEIAKPEPKVEEITFTRALFYGDASDNLTSKKKFAEEFEKLTGVKMNLVVPPREEFTDKVNMAFVSGEAKGIYELFLPLEAVKYAREGVILPLDDYIKDNPILQKAPQDWLNLYKFDGHIWAVPAQQNNPADACFMRTIRKDWLDNLGLPMPTTVDEFYEVARAFTFDDPDKNGKDDTYGLTAAGVWNLTDIFYSFDSIINNTGDTPWGRDPDEPGNPWVDGLLMPGAADALKYLNKMYEEGILDKEVFTNTGAKMREKILSGTYGSTFYWARWGYQMQQSFAEGVPGGKLEAIPYLKGRRQDKITPYDPGGNPLVLAKDTPNPKETFDVFVSVYYDDPGYMLFNYGIEGYSFKRDPNNPDVLLSLPDPEKPGSYLAMTGGRIPPNLKEYIVVPIDQANPENIQKMRDVKRIPEEIVNQGIKDGGFYRIFNMFISDTYNAISADVQRIYKDLLVKAITGEVPVEQALDEYRKQMKALGADKILQEANEALGLKAIQTY